MKTCSQCYEEKMDNEFYRRSSSKDGLEGRCKDCRNQRFSELRQQYCERGVDLTVRFKRCPSCEQTLHVQEFGHCRSSYDGYQSYYRVCSAGIDTRRQTSQARKDTKNRYHNKRRQSWQQYFVTKHGDFPRCQVCSKILTWDKVVFDHRHGGIEPIQVKPSNWLRSHWCNAENLAIWEQCDFGIMLVDIFRRLYHANSYVLC